MTQTLSQLENSGAFIERHIGPDAAQQQEMLNAVGAQSLNALTGQIVPKDIQLATLRINLKSPRAALKHCSTSSR